MVRVLKKVCGVALVSGASMVAFGSADERGEESYGRRVSVTNATEATEEELAQQMEQIDLNRMALQNVEAIRIAEAQEKLKQQRIEEKRAQTEKAEKDLAEAKDRLATSIAKRQLEVAEQLKNVEHETATRLVTAQQEQAEAEAEVHRLEAENQEYAAAVETLRTRINKLREEGKDVGAAVFELQLAQKHRDRELAAIDAKKHDVEKQKDPAAKKENFAKKMWRENRPGAITAAVFAGIGAVGIVTAICVGIANLIKGKQETNVYGDVVAVPR